MLSSDPTMINRTIIKNRVYIDGHERDEVVHHCKSFLSSEHCTNHHHHSAISHRESDKKMTRRRSWLSIIFMKVTHVYVMRKVRIRAIRKFSCTNLRSSVRATILGLRKQTSYAVPSLHASLLAAASHRHKLSPHLCLVFAN